MILAQFKQDYSWIIAKFTSWIKAQINHDSSPFYTRFKYVLSIFKDQQSYIYL
jgi:hypothetical protein